MRILITGSAGFIGSHLVRRLLLEDNEVIGVDNINDYYDPKLKLARLAIFSGHARYKNFNIDISDRAGLAEIFIKHKPHKVVNLAAQAGVRYSIENPYAYIDSNISGFLNVLELCRHNDVQHLIYASSSSVYGNHEQLPFSESHYVDRPISLYAATKKSNELMAHAYSHLFKIPTTGLRFFTVYGPWGRPDMAMFMFAKAIENGDPINIFNNGQMKRDFTYIDDVVDGILNIVNGLSTQKTISLENKFIDQGSTPYNIYNIGNNEPIELLTVIGLIEKYLGKSAIKNFLPIQPGDVNETFADTRKFFSDFNFKPSTSIDIGVEKFIDWYKSYS